MYVYVFVVAMEKNLAHLLSLLYRSVSANGKRKFFALRIHIHIDKSESNANERRKAVVRKRYVGMAAVAQASRYGAMTSLLNEKFLHIIGCM